MVLACKTGKTMMPFNDPGNSGRTEGFILRNLYRTCQVLDACAYVIRDTENLRVELHTRNMI